MGVYWLVAPEAMAAVVAESASRGVYDWPSLSMAGFHERDFAALWGIFRIASDGCAAATGELLSSNSAERTAVTRLNTLFIQRLGALAACDLERIAAEWQRCEGVTRLPPENAEEVLGELASFALCATQEGTPVLQVVDER